VFGAVANAAYTTTSTQLGVGNSAVPHPAALFDATHRVFVGLVVVAVVLVAAVLCVPRTVHELDIDAPTA